MPVVTFYDPFILKSDHLDGIADMKVDLHYGRNGITVNLADNIPVTVIRKHPMTSLSNPVRAVKKALETPIGCP